MFICHSVEHEIDFYIFFYNFAESGNRFVVVKSSGLKKGNDSNRCTSRLDKFLSHIPVISNELYTFPNVNVPENANLISLAI